MDIFKTGLRDLFDLSRVLKQRFIENTLDHRLIGRYVICTLSSFPAVVFQAGNALKISKE